MRSFSKHVLFEAPTHVREMFLVTAPGKGWERFHKFFGKDAERITVSRVAFDRANHYALVHVSAGISANGAGGELFLLRRETGKWTIKRTFPTWTT